MRQWRRSVACTVILALFYLAAGRPADGHSGDVTLAELREQPGATYQLRVDLPDALAGSTLTPQLPTRCRVSPETAPEAISPTIVQIEFTCDGQSLTARDTLHLPWPTAGGIVTVYWLDGSSQSQFFTADEQGVMVLLSQLFSTDSHWIPQIRQDAIAGFRHLFIAWPHLLFLCSLALWTRSQRLVRLVTAFTLGSLISAAIAGVSGASVPLLAVETGLIGTAAMLALLAAWKSTAVPQWSLLPLAALGLFHGLGWAGVLSSGGVAGVQLGVRLLVFNLGIDAAQLFAALAITGGISLSRRLPQPSRWRLGMGLSLAGFAVVAIAVPKTYQSQALVGLPPTAGMVLTPADDGNRRDTSSEAISTINSSTDLSDGLARVDDEGTIANPSADAQTEASQALAVSASTGDRPFPAEMFVVIDPFGIRSEILLDVSPFLESGLIDGPPSNTVLAVDEQEAFKERVVQTVLNGLLLRIDGAVATPTVDQADFLTVTDSGVVNRDTPAPEALSEALLGLVLRYPATDVPQAIALEWTLFNPTIQQIATTITDPNRSTEQILTPEQAIARWQNTLVDIAAPSIEAIDVSTTQRMLPIASLALVIAALWLDKRGLPRKREQKRGFLVATRTVLPLAIWAYPIAALPLTLPAPFQPQPSSTQVALILEQLLGNIYRSFEYRSEEDIYDKLAISVVGEQLTEIYLESRRALELENRGGARARVDQVDVTEISSIHSAPGKQLLVQGEWRVGGSVTHFGHTHYRHNLYVAAITLTYVDSVWKIKRIDVLDEHRLL